MEKMKQAVKVALVQAFGLYIFRVLTLELEKL